MQSPPSAQKAGEEGEEECQEVDEVLEDATFRLNST